MHDEMEYRLSTDGLSDVINPSLSLHDWTCACCLSTERAAAEVLQDWNTKARASKCISILVRFLYVRIALLNVR
jgi:hypothetical protein